MHGVFEWGERNGKCIKCKRETVVVTAGEWKTHPSNLKDQDFVEPGGEVSGHYCPGCNRLTAVFINP